ncbi:hypothetical protein GCM10029978_071380 [Actinoallomurus acanthiterrae]
MRVAELVGKVLAQLGAGPVFGVVGSGNFHVTNALRAHGVEFFATRHEGGAATAADAFARMSGRVAVVSTHQGCGLSNAMTGIGEAAKSRTPLLVVTGDTPGSDLLSNFRIDQDALVRSVGAVAERVYSPDTAVADTVRAFRSALHQRRTVVLNLPLDVQAMEVPDPPSEVPAVGSAPTFRADSDAVRGLADLLADASRPVFVAGRGARAAAAEIRALADSCGALLATSAVANGLFHDDPWSLGISGGFSSPLTAELIGGADLVVGWGCALNMWTTRHGRLIGARARLAQVGLPVAALGDGGFHMGVSELETAVRLGLPLVVIVYNDAAYGAEVHHFGAQADLGTVRFPCTDIAAIARGFGCTGVTVRTVDDLVPVRTWLDGPRESPLVIDARIAEDGGSWWLAEAFHRH